MGLLDRKNPTGLPPPPAPTRRDANRWTLSDTAERHDTGEDGDATGREGGVFDVFEQMMAEAERREHERAEVLEGEPVAPGPVASPAPATAGARRRRKADFGALLMLVFGIMALLFAVQMIEDGDWVAAVGPLLMLFFLAQGWWRRSRQREGEDDTG